MALRTSVILAGIVGSLTADPVLARSAHGLTFAGDSPYVAAVEVVQHDKGAPPAFADGLRASVLAEAALYGTTGQPITLTIDIDKVHLKNPMKAMLIGDDNQTAGHVAVAEQASGLAVGKFPVKVDAERHRGASVALFLIGALDPTGYADVALMAANVGAAGVNRSGEEKAMDANFAAETLRQTFGDAKAKAAHAAKRPPLVEGNAVTP